MAFEQATIPVQNEAEFRQLRDAIDRVFTAPSKFLKSLRSHGLLVRQFEQVLDKELIERADEGLKKSGRSARQVYQSLPVSDQAQIREFYLERLEKVGDEWRRKFHTVYRLV